MAKDHRQVCELGARVYKCVFSELVLAGPK
jgi:hypothetical protein